MLGTGLVHAHPERVLFSQVEGEGQSHSPQCEVYMLLPFRMRRAGTGGGEEGEPLSANHGERGHMRGRQRGSFPGWVVAPVAAASLACWHLTAARLSGCSPVVRTVLVFLLVGCFHVAARLATSPWPIVFFQDILSELAVYAVAGAACGLLIGFLESRWSVSISPVWPALAVHVVLAFLMDDRRAS